MDVVAERGLAVVLDEHGADADDGGETKGRGGADTDGDEDGNRHGGGKEDERCFHDVLDF